MQPPKKIVIIGPESTGKSVLSAALATALHTVWVPEYARAYLEALGRPYEEGDLLAIAEGQLRSEDALASAAGNFLICDTDLHVIKVWAEARYERCHRHVLEAIATRHYDAYLLTGIDMPWAEDPLREHPAEKDRHYFHHIYKDIVQQSGLPWTAISGNEATRLATAQKFVEALRR